VRILGVDPGSRATGWAVVAFDGPPTLLASGVIRAPASLPFGRRLEVLYAGLREVIDRERPDAAAIEKVFAGINPQSLIALGQARGVLLLALAGRSLAVGELTPAEVKRAVTGSGNAEKQQVRRMVGALLPDARRRTLPLDAADAAAVALAHGYRIAIRGAHLARVEPPNQSRDLSPHDSADASQGWRRRPSG
jgi:crossover junction endodeoxyribonuclease RuvC